MKCPWLLPIALSACAVPAPPADIAAPPVTAQSVLGPKDGVDHVLLWTREVEEDTRVLKDKLGFQVVPGGSFPDGVANRLAMFADDSYLELLYFAEPVSRLDDAKLEGVQFLRQRDGSVGFGIHAADLERVEAGLKAKGFALDAPTPGNYDPDGPGPKPSQDSLFRTLAFKPSPIPGLDPFFVWYAPWPARDAAAQARLQARRTHPNTAMRVTAVWILAGNPAAARSTLANLGFAPRSSFRMEPIGARAAVFGNARAAIVVVEPDAAGRAADALRLRGPHVAGVSVQVTDLAAAQRLVERGYGAPVRRYRGGFGQSILAPAEADLGLFVEFHSVPGLPPVIE